MKMKKPKTIPIRDVSTIAMVNGNELKHPTIIHDGMRKQWVGFGWVTEGPATERDKQKLPEVK